MARINSNCSADMLVWAREQAGYTIEAAAKSLDVDVGVLEEWEYGASLPSFAQLEKIATKYRRPTMVFYLESPPHGEFQVVKDLRTTAASRDEGEFGFSPEAMYALRMAKEKQAWAKSLLEDDENASLPFVGAIQVKDSPTNVALKIRQLFGITLEQQLSWPATDTAFRQWKQHIEQSGIFVFQFSGVAVDEMRGFALADRVAPVISVNAKDNYAARTFSMLHELAHVLIGVTAVSDMARHSKWETERFCECVAAEILMPLHDVKKQLPRTIAADNIEHWVSYLHSRYKCSKTAALYRLVDLERITFTQANELSRFYTLHTKKPARNEVAIPQSTLAVSRNGKYFSQLVVSAFMKGAIHGGELVELLGMKLNHLPKLEKLLGASNG